MNIPYTTLALVYTVWTTPDNPNISVASDGEKFLAVINAGITGETFLAVAFSSPNYAWTPQSGVPVEPIAAAIDAKFHALDWGPLMDQMPNLLALCEAANETYNRLLFTPEYKNAPETMGVDDVRYLVEVAHAFLTGQEFHISADWITRLRRTTGDIINLFGWRRGDGQTRCVCPKCQQALDAPGLFGVRR